VNVEELDKRVHFLGIGSVIWNANKMASMQQSSRLALSEGCESIL